ncbi:rhamnogalacturonan lyase [Bacteroides sp. 214]|uniref:rhamnogalacturonan lyase family protein n=1 Tax=Bacteroides sp. 214 TaxID=2302935 RepID=UPI0027153DEA|nr:rhamnogalacturonan lyase [Bacteroides sp. 214]
METLDRSLVAIKLISGVHLNWRLQGNEKEVAFNIYKNGELLQTVSATEATNITDKTGKSTDIYKVKAVINGKEEAVGSKEVTPWAQQYMTIQLNRPESGITPPNYVKEDKTTVYANGENYSYFPNDSSVGDLDGDGEYEIIVMWRPTNARDNAHSGITGEVFIDAYKLDGTQLWRIGLGKNIRAGSHYTQLLVYDFDGDGRSEIVCKTAPGTIDGKGKHIIMNNDDPNADYRSLQMNSTCGYILDGPEYLTVFDGLTGEELHTVPYEIPRGNVSSWGDSYGNRVDRFLSCVAYLDGVRPSFVMCRGYYKKTTLVAYDFRNGKIEKRWEHISDIAGEGAYGQGNHNLSVADVDGDGFDEIIYGSCAINHDGTLLYRTGLGHGDAMHVSDLDPDRPGLEVWQVLEEAPATSTYGYEMHDARTGEIIWGGPSYNDNGRGLAADIDPNHRGFEMWSAYGDGTYNCKGELISTSKPTISFRIYWDGDLQDEILDGNAIAKWNGSKANNILILTGTSIYGSRKSPMLSADILGDWREEVILMEANDSTKIRIYTTRIPTEHRLYTLMHDPMYRLSVAWQNVCYNQPPHLSFYIGDGLTQMPWPQMYTAGNKTTIEEIKKESKLNAHITTDNVLKIHSKTDISNIMIYSAEGLLLNKISGCNDKKLEIPLAKIDTQMLIVKVVTNNETESIKLIKRF